MGSVARQLRMTGTNYERDNSVITRALGLPLHYRLVSALWLALTCTTAQSADAPSETVRVGVLKFGTVNWELDVMEARNLAQKHRFNLKVIPLASGDASTIALQGGAVDVIVSDWIWVTRQRGDAYPYTFVPFSNAVGSVMVKADSDLKTIADLKGKSIGISGGPSDKMWLLLRAYAAKTSGVDLATATKPVYVAPPLLNELAMGSQVDAALNVWHYGARLEASGMHPLIKFSEVLAGLGIDKPIPLIGWVFRDDWAAKNTELLKRFFAASMEAKGIMAKSDAEWDRLKPLMRAEDNTTFLALRAGYRNGIPGCADPDYASTVAATFKILADVGGEKLVGKSPTFNDGTFWSGFKLPVCPKK
jgi:NitT/TauT family transport system substrate-binding protein